MTVFWLIIALMVLIAIGFVVWPLLHRPHRQWGLAFIVVMILPLMAWALYQHWGSSRQLAQGVAWQAQMRAERQIILTRYGSVEGLIFQLRQRVMQQPDSVQGWYLLGKLYLRTQRYAEAVEALARANQLRPRDLAILLPYAEALVLQHDNRAESVLQEIATLKSQGILKPG